MPRTFRFFVKKRGARRTDSSQVGNLALALFFGLLFFSGLGFSAYMLSSLVIPEWRVNHRFLEGQCVVLAKRLRERVEASQKTYRPELHIAYDVDGISYQSRTYDIARARSADKAREEALLDHFDAGKRYPCWYDPNDPNTVVVVRGYTWPDWALLLLPISFVGAGGVGLVFSLLRWGMSTERRAALAQKTIKRELLDLTGEPANPFPNVPRGVMQGDSPGTVLAYRLPLDPQSTWALMALSGISLGVLLLATVFVWMAVNAYRAGHPDWFMAVFATSWVVVGTGGIGYCLRKFVTSASIGPTILEVSGHPLRPGDEYEVFLSQAGRSSLDGIELTITCDERTTYHQGTNTRTESCRVFEERLLHGESIRLRRGGNFETRGKFRIPPRQMHSFVSDHNEVAWHLVVTGKMPGDIGFNRRFRVVVLPPREEGTER